MNKAESDRLAAALEGLGLAPVPSPRDADVIVLNSCVVRQSAESKVLGMLGMVKSLKGRDQGPTIALTGCMVSPKDRGLRRRFPHVDVFTGPGDHDAIIASVAGRVARRRPGGTVRPLPLRPPVATYVPITQGCDLMCAYCVIPYRRGRQVSRPVEELVEEVELLVRRGAKEVTLLGQTVDLYGRDLPGKPDLAALLRAVSAVSGLERIRFLTSHPRFMTWRIIRAIAELEKVCEHIDLPVQAGSDEVLRRMRRGYTSAEYRRLVQEIRAAIPGVALSTDVVVGFPGETVEQFEETRRLLEELRFDKVHVAAYSPRPETLCQRTMPDDVPGEEKRRRLHIIEELQEQIATEINRGLLGQAPEVLVEERHREMWRGRTRSDKLVFFKEDSRELQGHLVRVRIERSSPWSLKGSLYKGAMVCQ